MGLRDPEGRQALPNWFRMDRNRRSGSNALVNMPVSETDPEAKRRRTPLKCWVMLGVVLLLALLVAVAQRSKARAEWIQCANMLSSLECAARCYALDYQGTYAPNLQCMSNELSTTKILICPSERDSRRLGG